MKSNFLPYICAEDVKKSQNQPVLTNKSNAMLIRYSVDNFLSFHKRSTFSMLPGKGTLKSFHKTEPVNGVSVLKTSVIFGANASGKSNLIKAIDFGRRLVVKGMKSGQMLDFQNFRLNTESIKGNSRMEYEIQVSGKNYAYGFVFNSTRIVEEWLYEIKKTSQRMIFERNIDAQEIYNIDTLLKSNPSEEDKQFLKFTVKGTPDNQLLLTEFATRKVASNVKDITDVMNVYNWFLNQLKVIFPNTRYNEGIMSEISRDKSLHDVYTELLKYFGTGISDVSLIDINIDSSDIPPQIIQKIKEELLNINTKDVRSVLTINKPNIRDIIIFSREGNEIKAQKFMTKHEMHDGSGILFEAGDESDGTNRIIDFIPLIVDLMQGDNVFIIDEIERSLHPNLIYDIFDLFLDAASSVNSQLIATTHESSLLTQKLFRKDEIWFVVKNPQGESRVYSLEDYNVRFDKNIRKDYLLGRFKAIPRLGNRYELSILKPEDHA